MRRYLSVWLTATGLLLVVAATLNFAVDPYNLIQTINKRGFNSIKPKAAMHVAMSKPYQVLRIRPKSLILGNSRAEVGFDPEHPAWPESARPAFNLALPGTGVSTARQHLQHVLSADPHGLKIVLLGLDFIDFLVDADSLPQPAIATDADSRLLVNPDGSTNMSRPMNIARDYGISMFSLIAVADSLHTLASQNDLRTKDRTPLGFNPMRDYLKVTAKEGYWAVFRQAYFSIIKSFVNRPKDLFHKHNIPSTAIEELRKIISICQNHNIDLYLTTYPYHASLLEITTITGHWNAFQDWKRLLTKIVDEANNTPNSKTVVLWDFADTNEITSDNIPLKSDLSTRVHWYWEAGHFKRELGDIMLDRILGRKDTQDNFGIILNSNNVEVKIKDSSSNQSYYHNSHLTEINELKAIAADFKT